MTAGQSLGSRAIRGGGVTLAGQGAKLTVQVAALIVLGRVLKPSDFGLLAMVMAITGVAEVVRDMGLSSAAVQVEHLSQWQKSNLFWINVCLGSGLAALVVASAGAIASIYGDARLRHVVPAVAVVFLFNGIQTQFQADLVRRMRFGVLAASDASAALVGFVAALAMATGGAGYWSLVAQLVVQSGSLLLMRAACSRWLPSKPRRGVGTGPLLRYGWNLMCTQVLVYFSSNIDTVIVGARFGASMSGLYNRGFQLLSLPLNQIFAPMTNVALPVLSYARRDAERFRRSLLSAQIILGYGVVGILAFGVAIALPVVPLVFGEQWRESASVFRVLAVGGAFQAISYVSYWIFLAKGLTGRHLRYSLLSRSILASSIVVGSSAGVEGVAWGYSVGVAIGWPLSLWWLRRSGVADVGDLFANGARILGFGICSGGAGLLVSMLTGTVGPLVQLVSSSLAACIVAVAILSIRRYREDVVVVKRAARDLVKRRHEAR